MTPEFERRTLKVTPGNATPEYLLRSAMITSNWKMNNICQDIRRQIRARQVRHARTRNRQHDTDRLLDQLDDNILRDKLQFFDKVKSIAISVRNDRQYTESVRLLHPLNCRG